MKCAECGRDVRRVYRWSGKIFCSRECKRKYRKRRKKTLQPVYPSAFEQIYWR